jgi:type IV pilus assembly protein PilW
MPHARSSGFSLIELMISVALGLLLTAAVVAVFGSALRSNTDTLRAARLNQDLSTVLSLMVNDIRRAGYANTVDGLYSDDTASGGDDANDDDITLVSPSCVLYSYDSNSDGVVENSEWFGFRLEAGAIRMRSACGAGPDADSNCDTDCDAGTWEAVTDPSVVNVTGLTFGSAGSKCQNIDTNAYWLVTAAASTTLPCTETNAGNVTYCAYDAAADSYACGGALPAPAVAPGERTVETRQVNILLQAQLAADANVRKQIQVSVKISNNRVRQQP